MKTTFKFTSIVTTFLAVIFVAGPSKAESVEDVKSFVGRQYSHGIPYAKAMRYDKSSSSALLAMLKDEKQKENWNNIVMLLGMIGDEAAVDPLTALVERDFRGEIDPYALRAVLLVPTALGHIAAKEKGKALRYLLDNGTLESWKQKTLPWTIGGRPASQVFATAFYTSVIAALGVSAEPDAVTKLHAIKEDKSLHSEYREGASEALDLADEINRKGRIEVFSKPRRREK